jgi:hemolysin III
MVQDWKSSVGEEVASAITHGFMGLLALFALPYVAVRGYLEGGTLGAITKSIFVISLVFMFTVSCLYHSMALDSSHKRVFRLLDHVFIFVAIAGSYTPLALIKIGGALGWAVVIIGVLSKSLAVKAAPKVNLAFYLLMGWTAVVLLPSIIRRASTELLLFILAGGLFYTIGAVIYALKGFRYHHMVWHIFINLGALSHFIAIVLLT